MEDGAFRKAELISKYLSGDLSPGEQEEFRQWLDADAANGKLLAKLENEKQLDRDLRFLSDVNSKAAWENVGARINNPVPEPRLPVYLGYWKYAAAVLIFGLLSYAVFDAAYKPKGSVVFTEAKQTVGNDVLPGGDKATLTLADGSIVSLEDMENGTVREENGIRVSKKDGQIVYELVKQGNNTAVTYNTITTPVGGQYSIVLPDGSRVWLNSASSLHFPTAFIGQNRDVELTGEGYFEVAKNEKMPFIVQAGKTNVSVLGTHFNLMAYANEGVTKTTLLEGSVKVGNGSSSRTIVPGEQALTGENVQVRTVDTEEAVAWKNGYFQFENEDLRTIMRQLKRWYNVDVDNEQQIPDKHFTAVISRNTNLAQVLRMLEMSGELEFKIEGNRITIQENK
ncbi:FecR family protein [Dyadobacter bucti]|uniref:FecR family protein n=1 Tax=Dyadobacter bucti TaxID=2572203 RepID=UPI00110981B9|nr:FecR family protein [Dyadobacter bucti]